jgi:diguanylate cyclase (GGDEF)-like protein
VLRKISSILQDSVRPYDSVGRYGGDEFVLVLPGAGSTIAERVRAATESVGVTLSIGVAATAEDADHEELIEQADAALFRAKAEGRDRDRVCHAED